MLELILKVQKSYDKYRLEFTKQDSLTYIKERGAFIDITILPYKNIQLKTTCGPHNNKGYDLLNKEIHHWILLNKYHDYPKGKPTKLIFKYQFNEGIHFLTFHKTYTE